MRDISDLSEDEELMLHGHCHLFAIAMHELTGFPIAAYLDTDLESEATVLVHAFVIKDGSSIDVRGAFKEDEILDEFDTFDPYLVHISREDLLELGHGRRTLSAGDPDMKRALAIAVNAVGTLTDIPAPPSQP